MFRSRAYPQTTIIAAIVIISYASTLVHIRVLNGEPEATCPPSLSWLAVQVHYRSYLETRRSVLELSQFAGPASPQPWLAYQVKLPLHQR